eukprot:g5695.t1
MSAKHPVFTVLVLISILCTQYTTLTDASPSRQLLQSSTRESVIIDDSNSNNFSQVLTAVLENSTIELHVAELELTEVTRIETPGLRIIGVGATPVVLVCAEASRLELIATNITLRNLRIENCKNGGALFVSNPEANYNPFEYEFRHDFKSMQITLENLEFVNNTVNSTRHQGGAIHIGAGTHVVIIGSKFVNNSASTGGAIGIDGGSSLTLANSSFVQNQAVLVGGAIAAGISDNFINQQSTSLSIQNCSFEGNRDLSGGEDPTGLTLANGAPLENSVFLKFPSPAPSGGAIYVQGFTKVEIKECVFRDNHAVSAGGALYINDNENVKISNCTFDGNGVSTQNPRDADLELGGAVYLVFTNVESEAQIDRCLFKKNTAAFGGAVHTVTPLSTKLSIENSLFEDNFAHLAAGGLLMRNTIQSKIRNVRFVQNRAISGGGMVLTNGAGAFFFMGPSTGIERDIYFIRNLALDGGGLFLLGAGQASLQSVRFDSNQARRNGGGICLIESLPSGHASIQEGVFQRNVALRGGAIYVDSVAQFTLTSLDENYENKFVQNRALAGGALYIRPTSQVNNLIKIIRSLFTQNYAVATHKEARIDAINIPDVKIEITALGRRLMFHRSLTKSSNQTPNRSKETLLDPESSDGCNPGGGGAICLLVSQVPERAPIEVLISQSQFVQNHANVGGALFLATNVANEWNAKCDSLGSATESLTSKPCKALLISQVSFIKNQAKFTGGAIFASHPISVYFDRKGNSKQVTLDTLSLKDYIFQNNSVRSGGFGPNIASNAAYLEIIRPRVGPEELLFSKHNSGMELEGGIKLVVLDVYNQIVTHGICDSTLSVSINSNIISGQRVATAQKGIVHFTKVIARGPPTHHSLTFEPNSPTVKSIRREFTIRHCFPGEFKIEDQHICDECRKDYFGFNCTFNCDGCPENAICPGGAALVPEDGFWHSTPFSPIVHECILEDACSYSDRETKLASYYEDPINLHVSNQSVENDAYPQCAEGYEGILCGSCADGYGHVVDGECVKCKRLWLTALLIGFVCLWTLFLLVSTAQQAFDTIREMHDVRLVRISAVSEGCNLTVNSNVNEVSFTSRNSSNKFESSTGDENVDHIMASERIAEIIKILTNFLQVTAVGVGINASWTQSVSILLVIEDSISSISSGASFVPMECLIKHMEDRSLIVNILKSRLDFKNLRRTVIIQVLVGLFFAYDTVSEMLMRIVSCVSLDVIPENLESASNVVERYGAYAIARESYWAEDTRHVCWKGTHGWVAGVLGIPGLVLFTFSLPILLAAFLMYKRSAEVVMEPEFLNTYGFVFQSYRVKFVYWESVVMLRKASMAAVIVYSYDLGPNLQAAVALGILIFSLLAQFLAQPFKYNSLNVLESLSLLASIFVFYAGVIFNDPNTSYAGKVALSVIIVLTNIVIVGVFLYCLFNAYDNLIIVKLRMAKAPIHENWFHRAKQLSFVQAEKVKEKLAASTKRSGTISETIPEQNSAD